MTTVELEIPKINNSKRSYKAFVLKNGLKVLVVSDPKANQSSAALDVAVGSMQDPKNEQGLFHFLEHMLFLGTKKFPDISGYSAYLKANNGYSNAYTAEENTNYHFEVSHEGLEEALDRFSQFFIAPLFDESGTEKEVRNVNSEHQKNIPNDYWRARQILRSQFIENHPANHFSTGNEDTLKKCRRESLINHFQTYYSSNQMSLCILSNRSISELEHMAVQFFSDIPNKSIESISYPEVYLKKENTLRILNIEPVNDVKSLNFHFALPKNTFIKYMPLRILSSILGHEGKGTITSHLKNKGLITALSSGGSNARSYSSFAMNITLTEQGLKEKDYVIETVFQYIHLMQKEKFPRYYYDEQVILSALELENSAETEGTKFTSYTASLMQEYELSKVLTEPNLIAAYEAEAEKGYFYLLNELKPENCIVSLIAKGLETDAEETYYKAKYKLIKDENIFKKINQNTLNENLKLPEANPYIPKNSEILAPRPYQLVYNDKAEIWFQQDQIFMLPKASIKLLIITNEHNASPLQNVLTKLYILCLKDALNEEAYPMQVAGLDFSISPTSEGIQLTFNGYNDTIDKIYLKVVHQLKSFSISDEQFINLKDKLKRSIENSNNDPAYKINFRLFNELINETYYTPEELLAVFDSIKKEAILQHAKKLYHSTYLKGSIYGNLKAVKAYELIQELLKTLDSKTLPKDKWPSKKIAQLSEKGREITIRKKLPTNNSALYSVFHLGKENPKYRGIFLVLDKILSAPYYDAMRTQKGLGYITWSFMTQSEHNLYMGFVIQSGQYTADELLAYSNEFIQKFKDTIDGLTSAELATYQKAVIDAKLEKDKSIDSLNNRFYYQAFFKEQDFDHVASDIKAVEEITVEDIKKHYHELISQFDQAIRINILTYGSQHKQVQEDTKAEEVNAIKSKLTFEE